MACARRATVALSTGMGIALLGSAGLGLVLLVALAEGLGLNSHILPGLASQQVSVRPHYAGREIGPVFDYKDVTMLSLGHRCESEYVFVHYPGAATCVDANGKTIRMAPDNDYWALKCCQKVVEDSNEEVLASIRRWQPSTPLGRLGHGAAYWVGMPLLFGFLVMTPLLLFAITRFTFGTPFVIALRLMASFLRGASNTYRVLLAPELVRSDFLRGTSQDSLVICHLSDLHLVELGDCPEELRADARAWRERRWGPINGAEIVARTTAAFALACRLNPAAIVVTGDVTDSGTEKQWSVWTDVLRTSGLDTNRALLVVPGNHDLTFNRPDSPDVTLEARSERRIRFDRATSKLFNGQSTYDESEFPKVRFIPIQNSNVKGVHVILLDSNNYPARHGISGALGRFGRDQLLQMRKRLGELNGPIIVATHHHLGKIPGEGLRPAESVQDSLMLALDAEDLLDMLRSYARRDSTNRVLVLHGHRHRFSYVRDRAGLVEIFGLPSTTLGMHRCIHGQSFLDGWGRVAAVYLTSDLNWALIIHSTPRST